MNAVAEGLKFGAKYDLPEAELLNLFKVSTGDSWVARNWDSVSEWTAETALAVLRKDLKAAHLRGLDHNIAMPFKALSSTQLRSAGRTEVRPAGIRCLRRNSATETERRHVDPRSSCPKPSRNLRDRPAATRAPRPRRARPAAAGAARLERQRDSRAKFSGSPSEEAQSVHSRGLGQPSGGRRDKEP